MEKEINPNNITIIGEINNYEATKSEVEYLINNVGYQTLLPVLIDSKGQFKIQYYNSFPHEMIIIMNDKPIRIIANPNDTIYLRIDNEVYNNQNNCYKGISFLGNSEEINNLINKYSEADFLKKDTQRIEEYVENYSPVQYKNYQDNLLKKKFKNLCQLIEKENLSNEFENYAILSLRLNYYNSLLSYKSYFKYINRNQKSKNIPDEYLSFLDSVNLNFDVLKSNRSFYFLLSYIGHLKEVLRNERQTNTRNYNPLKFKKNKELKNNYVEKRMGDEKQNIKKDINQLVFEKINGLNNEDFQELLMCFYLNYMISNFDLSVYKKNRSAILDLIGESAFFKEIEQNYNKKKAFMDKPFEQNKVKFIVESKIDGTEIFNQILKKGKNKIIYIDCWGTWCRGCIQDFPFANKLKKKYQKRNVDFVYLCFRSKESEWRRVINEQKLSGTHYLLTTKQANYFKKNYFERNGFPNYIIIDTNQEVRFKGFEYRAQNYKTSMILDNLLNE